jgi:hypothetical protein
MIGALIADDIRRPATWGGLCCGIFGFGFAKARLQDDRNPAWPMRMKKTLTCLKSPPSCHPERSEGSRSVFNSTTDIRRGDNPEVRWVASNSQWPGLFSSLPDFSNSDQSQAFYYVLYLNSIRGEIP